MSARTSPTLQVKRIAGLLGTKDLTDWEHRFVESVVKQTRGGDDTTSLTDKQLDVVERIFTKHFAA
jgi:hypothetical protein